MSELACEVREHCCPQWARAHEDGTDNELYGSLIGYRDGVDLPGMGDNFLIRFCPFCGAKKGEKQSAGPSTFLDELNQAVSTVQRLPRVRFDIEVGPDAENWLRRKHADGAVHEPATLAAFFAIRNRYDSRNIFDLGALYGYFTLFALQAFADDAKVTAFEMHPGCIGPLVQNVAPWATCVHAVVSDEVSPARRIWISGFNIFEEPAGGWEALETIPGAMKQRGENNRGRGYAQVDFITLDSYCAENDAPDLIKIDVEAYQAKAILGGMETIRKHKPAIIVELHDADKIARMGTTNALTVQPLFDCGYQAFWCGNFRDKDARFEPVAQMGEEHERLSLMVFVP